MKAQRPVFTGLCAFTLPEGKTAGQVFGKRQGRNKNSLGGSYLPITDVMVNPVALTCLPLCTVVSENNYIVRRTALFGRRKAVLQTMVYRYEFFWH